ncbi:MAG: MlaD family protein [Pseudomonadota bacterium]
MSRAGFFETIVGVLVVALAAAFLAYAYNVSGRDLERGAYELSAVFGRVDGIAAGSEVRMAGVKIGAVRESALNTKTFEATVKMAIADGIPVPEDSIAKIVSDGVLGGAHVSIEPGAAEELLVAGDAITITRGSVDLLGLAVQAFTSNVAADEDSDAAGEDDDAAGEDPLGDL